MNDEQMLELLTSNPSMGLRELINRYTGLLTAVASRILKNPQDVEECVADAFISMWKTLHKLEKPEGIKGYLICTARNNAIDRYNRLKNQSYSTDEIEIISDEDMEMSVIDSEFIDKLQSLIMKMSPVNREIFTRKLFMFETDKEIAAAVGLSESKVKARLYRGRKSLRKALDERGNYNEYVVFKAV
ncbi:MAG: RNA polymerase sigma factor [Oscillospiraceae bacterium]|nr:RNA polymerase sigma factor [Oscillospiraceae bacterium]